jgi:hypothetical protein
LSVAGRDVDRDLHDFNRDAVADLRTRRECQCGGEQQYDFSQWLLSDREVLARKREYVVVEPDEHFHRVRSRRQIE